MGSDAGRATPLEESDAGRDVNEVGSDVWLVYGQDRRYERRAKAEASDFALHEDILENLWGGWLFEAMVIGAALETTRATQGGAT